MHRNHLANLVIAQLCSRFQDLEGHHLYSTPVAVVNWSCIYYTMQYPARTGQHDLLGRRLDGGDPAGFGTRQAVRLPKADHIHRVGCSGNAPDAMIQMKEWEFLVERNNEILARHTGQPLEKIKKDTDRDLFMSPEDAKDYGIIDAVYSEQWDSLTAQHHDEKAAEAAVEAGEAEEAPQPKRSKGDSAG